MKTRVAAAAAVLAVRCALTAAQTPAVPPAPAMAPTPAMAPAPAMQPTPAMPPAPAAAADFVVGDIRVEGMQRVSEGTVYNYLPVNIGDHITPQRAREAIRALYATGFFRDVQLRRDGNTLIVVVLERPPSRASRSPATRTSRPRICRNPCATWASPPARPSTARCWKTSPSTSPTSTSPAASTA